MGSTGSQTGNECIKDSSDILSMISSRLLDDQLSKADYILYHKIIDTMGALLDLLDKCNAGYEDLINKTLDIIKSNKLLRQEIKCWEIAASEWKPTINLMMLAIRAMEEEYANKDT